MNLIFLKPAVSGSLRAYIFPSSDVLIFNKFLSFLTLVPLKVIHSHAKSGIQHHLVIIKGMDLCLIQSLSCAEACQPSSTQTPAVGGKW